MNQGVIAAFKVCYLRRTSARAIAATEEGTEKTLMPLWKNYDIYDCINDRAWAWGDVINGIWKKALKDLPMTSKGLLRMKSLKNQQGCG